MTKLSKRQLKILEFIRAQQSANNQQIRKYLGNVSRFTVVRELAFLLKQGVLKQTGRGRGIEYQEAVGSEALQYFDIDKYFQKAPDERDLKFEKFNFDVLKNFKTVFSAEELQDLKKINSAYQLRAGKLSKLALKKEFERLTIELSWKSSRIEGNTYSLVDTEILIKENKEAAGHKKAEAIMILNHKKALDYIFSKISTFRKLNLFKIRNIHNLLIADLNVEKGLRKRPVGIVGTRYKPLDNGHQIKEAVQKMTKLINAQKDSFAKALLAILMISYIQPFEDGNKRTARIVGDAILLAHRVCPLSFRSVNEADYKKALLVFYEQNNIRFFKELFVEQFKFAVENYF